MPQASQCNETVLWKSCRPSPFHLSKFVSDSNEHAHKQMPTRRIQTVMVVDSSLPYPWINPFAYLALHRFGGSLNYPSYVRHPCMQSPNYQIRQCTTGPAACKGRQTKAKVERRKSPDSAMNRVTSSVSASASSTITLPPRLRPAQANI